MVIDTSRSTQAMAVALGVLALTGMTQAQNAPNCPLGGEIYLAPTNVLESSYVSQAIDSLRQSLDTAFANGTLGSSNNSFHISAFSKDEVLLDYSFASPALNESLTAGVLDRNTIFRIGSVSKVMAVYTLLAATGMKHINDPVTKWVPELTAASCENCDVNAVRWQDITIGALAGHMAGLLKDFSIGDLTSIFNASTLEQAGLPAIAPNEVIKCGSDPGLRACRRDEFFQGIKALHPVTSAWNMPIYSNPAFQIMAYSIEGMTNRSFADVFESSIVRPLDLTGTSLAIPGTTDGMNAIIPGNEVESWWKIDVGDGTSSAQGLMLSNGHDMTAIGQSILSSSLLAPAETRQWFKHLANTPDLRFTVGMPWEINRVELPVPGSQPPRTRLLDLYTKNGGAVGYVTEFVLSPDQGMGFVVLSAGVPPADGADLKASEVYLLSRMVAQALAPAFESTALDQAAKNFAGTYVAADNSSMELTLVAGDGRLGLGVQSWTANGINLLASYYAAVKLALPINSASPTPSLRLYPMGLASDEQVVFRGVYDPFTNASRYSADGTPFSTICGTWSGVGEPPHANIGLDDFVFEVDDSGKATAITSRGARKTLQKQG